MPTQYNLYDGGSGFLGYKPIPVRDAQMLGDRVEYAAGLKRSSYVIPFHFDLGDPDWSMWMQEKGVKKFSIGDAIVSHLLAAGSHVNRMVVQVRKGASTAGTSLAWELRGSAVASAAAAPATDPDEATDDANDGSIDPAFPGTTAVLLGGTTDLTVPGWTFTDVNQFLNDEGDVRLVLTAGELADACFTILVDVDDYSSQYGCSCRRAPCEYILPDPECQGLPL